MGPTTRPRAQQDTEVASDSSSDDDLGDAPMEGEDSQESEDTGTILVSPSTNITYDISSLDVDTQAEVKQLFRATPASGAPPLVLQWCQFNKDEQDNQWYAFQLHEVVPRSIRIGPPSSEYRDAKCNCMGETAKPCKHLLYLLDQLNYVAGDKHLDEPVQKLEPGGASTEMDQPFEKISRFHLDLLASSLHCNVGSPESQATVNPVRVEETREILAAVAQSDADDFAVKHFRPDIFEDRDGLHDHNIITYNDLTKTVANMLLTNNDFFAYFLNLLPGPTASRPRDAFRTIQWHVDRVFAQLSAYYYEPSESPAPVVDQPVAASAEGPRDIAWAAAHIRRAVATIQHRLQNRPDAPSPAERASAARTLVRIMHTVVFDWNRKVTTTSTTSGAAAAPTNPSSSSAAAAAAAASSSLLPPPPPPTNTTNNNLFHHLITPQDSNHSPSILDTLAQLPEQNQWIETLEAIEAKLGEAPPPPSPPATAFMRRLRDLIALMRSSRRQRPASPGEPGWQRGGSSTAAGSKRSSREGSGRARGRKRAR
ncbi:unnamed protein product [Discula destructiva]